VSEATQQPPNDKTEDEGLDTKTDDKGYVEKRIRSRGKRDPPVLEKQPSHSFSEVTSTGIVVN
jgi:hypothetical protein